MLLLLSGTPSSVTTNLPLDMAACFHGWQTLNPTLSLFNSYHITSQTNINRMLSVLNGSLKFYFITANMAFLSVCVYKNSHQVCTTTKATTTFELRIAMLPVKTNKTALQPETRFRKLYSLLFSQITFTVFSLWLFSSGHPSAVLLWQQRLLSTSTFARISASRLGPRWWTTEQICSPQSPRQCTEFCHFLRTAHLAMLPLANLLY